MITDVSLVSAGTTWTQKGHANLLPQVAWGMKKEYAKIACLIINLKEEYAKYKDVCNIQETTVKTARINTTFYKESASS